MRLRSNLLQFLRFALVGASGYALNLGVFAIAHRVMDFRLAAVVAFLVAVANNFVWNRAWTFADAREESAGFQAARFLVVSLGAFLFGLILLDVLVRHAGVDPLAAQAVALIASTPLNFAGNKLWSFRVEA